MHACLQDGPAFGPHLCLHCHQTPADIPGPAAHAPAGTDPVGLCHNRLHTPGAAAASVPATGACAGGVLAKKEWT
eukprot:scaffold88330_cov18-Tisochrysis_lutea.AAC.3